MHKGTITDDLDLQADLQRAGPALFPLFGILAALVLSLVGRPLRAAESSGFQILTAKDLLEDELTFGMGNSLEDLGSLRNRQMVRLDPVPDHYRGMGLEDLFQMGKDNIRRKRWQAAELCFRKILAVDPLDWEARESLVRVYQALGFRKERDAILDVLRKMHSAGKSWRQSICRDEFVLLGKEIRAYELPSLEFPERRQIHFEARDSAKGQFRFIACVNRMERRILPTFKLKGVPPGQSVPGFQLSFETGQQRRLYFVPYQKPRYSTMKKMLFNYLAGT